MPLKSEGSTFVSDSGRKSCDAFSKEPKPGFFAMQLISKREITLIVFSLDNDSALRNGPMEKAGIVADKIAWFECGSHKRESYDPSFV